jgi:HAD superfamily hydrolase (TIGR01509 family)
MIQTRFAALIFDLDGTLVQSEHLHRLSWDGPLAALGIFVDDERYLRDFAGKPGTQIARDHLGLSDPVLIQQLYEDVTAAYWDLAEGNVKPTRGLIPFLETLGDLPKAVCTSAQYDSATRMIAALGLADRFDVVVTASDVRLGKPDPEPFVLAAERLNVDPAICLAFEDSANGLRSARAAGMACVGIGDGRERYPELADIWIADFTDSRLEQWIV